ncbi:MAG: DUF3021 domain-containing protein [Methanobrevibacter sp.]|uniref:DUF3021 domain-containing protein n=1 Tax=Methanobrevibacter sp. TaxID=66852 RepID=UPI0025E14DC5|nr:DUF3021 domain-containing protein [Methanobrevibacter sp.]MBQ8016556.1 DUF3021 domain-containing protein [Methanobrevibacter sp.]
MKIADLIKSLALGAFVGCFIVMLVMVLISLGEGVNVVSFSGVDVINAFLGSIVAGWAFSLSGMIYEREDIALPFQIIFQMGIGMTVLFIIAIYLKWMPINFGWEPILVWVSIACIFAAVFWCGFYIYYYLLARDLNKKIVNSK